MAFHSINPDLMPLAPRERIRVQIFAKSVPNSPLDEAAK
jgi:hypothetical protein